MQTVTNINFPFALGAFRHSWPSCMSAGRKGFSVSKVMKITRMRDLRNMRVKDLSPEQCRKLQYHHHGASLEPMRRKAYLLKSNPGREMAYFKADEIQVIERAIEEGI